MRIPVSPSDRSRQSRSRAHAPPAADTARPRPRIIAAGSSAQGLAIAAPTSKREVSPVSARWMKRTATGAITTDPRVRSATMTRVRREIRVGGNEPTLPRMSPIDRQKPIIGHGLANGSLKTPRASEGTKIARKVAARIARTKIRICPAAHGRFSFQVTEYLRRTPSSASRDLGSSGRVRASSYVLASSWGISSRMSPSVASTSFRIAFPVEVFPQPLSPTRQNTSPRRMSRSTPSTARTHSGLPPTSSRRRPFRRGNQTFRFRIRISGLRSASTVRAPP